MSATPGGVLGGITVVLYGMIGLLGAKIWNENRVDFANPVNLVPVAAGIIIAIGDTSLEITDDFALTGIALGTIVTLVGYHLARAVAPANLQGRRRNASRSAAPASTMTRMSDRTRGRLAPRRRAAVRAHHGRWQSRRVKPPPFIYHRPAQLDEAVQLLAELGQDAKVLAGGQSLVPLMSMRLAAPAHLVDINHLPGLDTVEVVDDAVRVGALARHAGSSATSAAHAAVPAAAAGAASRRPPDDPQPGHDGRQPRARRPGRRDDRGAGAARRRASSWPGRPARDGSRRPTSSSVRWRPTRADELAVAATFPAPATGSGTRVRRARAPARRLRRLRGRRRGHARRASGHRGPGRPHLRGRRTRSWSTSAPAVDGGGVDVGRGRATWSTQAIDPEDDIHATAEYRRHLARVLTERAVAAGARRRATPTAGPRHDRRRAPSRRRSRCRQRRPHELDLPPRRLLSDALRHDLG